MIAEVLKEGLSRSFDVDSTLLQLSPSLRSDFYSPIQLFYSFSFIFCHPIYMLYSFSFSINTGLIICILYLEHGLFAPNLVVIITFQQEGMRGTRG